MINNNSDFNYETFYKDPFNITQCCNNGTVTLQCGAINISHNIQHMKPYTSDTNIEDIID